MLPLEFSVLLLLGFAAAVDKPEEYVSIRQGTFSRTRSPAVVRSRWWGCHSHWAPDSGLSGVDLEVGGSTTTHHYWPDIENPEEMQPSTAPPPAREPSDHLPPGVLKRRTSAAVFQSGLFLSQSKNAFEKFRAAASSTGDL
eukprot:Polyplicarium_translucidae@DN1908_c0_g1_i1.p2